MLKAILFDMDNTLIDFMKMKKKSCEAAIDSMIEAGLKIDKQEALKVMYELYDEHGIEHQLIFQKFLKKVRGKIDYKILAHGIVTYRRVREGHIVPYSNVPFVLEKLKKKYKLAVVSDAPIIPAWMRLVGLKLDGFFDFVITKASVKKQKTSEAPFKAVLKLLEVKPEEALMIGDSLHRDIRTPKKMGIKTCFARYGKEEKEQIGKGESGADFEIDDIKEVLEIVEKI